MRTISVKKAIDMAADYITIYDIDLYLWIINGTAECNREHAKKKDKVYRSLKDMLEHMLNMYKAGQTEQDFPWEQIMIYLDMLPEELLNSIIK